MKLLPIFCAAMMTPCLTFAEAPCCKQLPPTATYSDRSLYQLDSTWTSDLGKNIKLGVLRGRPQVVAMFFANCEYACPILAFHMKHLESSLPVELRGKVDFLLVSFDTERDTPEALHAFRERHKLDEAHWTLLRGNSEDVRELAALLGINYAKDSRGQFAHSNVITLLNAEGEIVHQHIGLSSPTEVMLKQLRQLTSADHLAGAK